MGSKSRISKHIVPIIQNYIDNNNAQHYIEPFVGGANVIDKIKCKNKIGSDLNKYLIALLKEFQENKGIYLPQQVTKEEYSKVREYLHNYPNNEDGIYINAYIGAVGFLASYNGRWFDGGYAKPTYEKTKNGLGYSDYYKEAFNNIKKQSQSDLFSDIKFNCCDYNTYLNEDYFNTVFYLDPPYQNTKQFDNSKKFNYDLFWDFAREISKNNICIISELQAPNDFKCIWEQKVNRSINASNKSNITEKLFIKS